MYLLSLFLFFRLGLCVQKGHEMDQGADSEKRSITDQEHRVKAFLPGFDLTGDWLPVVQHGYELDDNQRGEGQDEHEAQRVDVHVLSRELQVDVDLRHPDEDDRLQQLESERRHEPEGV